VRILCGCPNARCVLLFNKAGVEDPREILDGLHATKFALENIVSCDSLRDIDFMGRVWVGSALSEHTPSILLLEDVFDCDTVFKTQL
jgi:hypothetical protein